MSILNFGSLNIDNVYRVEHFVRPGETIKSIAYERFAGGKGLNQSVALAAAGARVFHAGRIGPDGDFLVQALRERCVDTRHIFTDPGGATGHAVIQVDASGQNSIVIHGGANWQISGNDAEAVLRNFDRNDFLLLQNEISSIPPIMQGAKKRGMTIVFNPAPMDDAVRGYPLSLVDYFIINEIEGAQLAGQTEPAAILASMLALFPQAATVLTLGERGSLYCDRKGTLAVEAVSVQVVDTTAAGDTYTGYFIAELIRHGDTATALRKASIAAAICVTRPGAANSIPTAGEVSEWNIRRACDRSVA